jgi:hypothetical protein
MERFRMRNPAVEIEPACLSDETLTAFGNPRLEIASDLEEMRLLANHCADAAKRAGDGDLYCRFKRWVGEMDGLRVVLSEQEGER